MQFTSFIEIFFESTSFLKEKSLQKVLTNVNLEFFSEAKIRFHPQKVTFRNSKELLQKIYFKHASLIRFLAKPFPNFFSLSRFWQTHGLLNFAKEYLIVRFMHGDQRNSEIKNKKLILKNA